MVMYVILKEHPCTGPPAFVVFSSQEIAQRVAEDPWDSLGWCISGRFLLERAEVMGAYTAGQPVYAAHTFIGNDPGWEVYRFVGLFAAFGDAEGAAGELGAVNKLIPDEYAGQIR